MGRYSGNNAGGHNVRVIEHGFTYRLSWTVDRYYSGSRLRHPVTYTRDTDEAGALRFCKKHGCTMPAPKAKADPWQ